MPTEKSNCFLSSKKLGAFTTLATSDMDAPSAGRYHRVILALVLLAQFLPPLVLFSLGALAPLLRDALALSHGQIGFLAALFSLSAALFAIPSGWGADKLGIRGLLSSVQVVGGLALVVTAWLRTYYELCLVMFLAGMTFTTVLVLTSKAIAEWFPRARQATAMGAKSAALAGAGIVAGAVISPLALGVGWRQAFALMGGLMLASACCSLLLYCDRPQEMSPAAPLPTTAPERSLWHERQLWKLALAGFCFGGVQYSFTTYLALFLSERWGVSSLFAARLLAQAHVGAIVSRVPYGWLSDRWRGGDCKAVLQGLSAVALGLLLLLLLLPPRLPLLLLSAIILLYGLSGLAWGGLYQTVAVEFSSPERAGVSAGIATTLLHLGNCAMAPVFGYLVDMTGSYTTAWGLLMLAQLLGIVLLGWVQPAPVPRQVMAASGVMKELHVCPKRDTNGVHVNGFRRPSRLALVAGIAAFGLLGAEIALHSSLTSRKLSEDTTRVVSRPLPPLPQGPALREAPKSVQWAQTTLSYQLPTGEPLTVPLPPLHHTPEDVPATVTLDASDSTPLWLTFDPETLALSGTAPPTETGKTYHLTFRAYTAHGLASPLHLALTLIAQSRPSLALPLKASGQRQSLTPVEEKCLLEKLQGNPCEDN